jgi:hypothetical protein
MQISNKSIPKSSPEFPQDETSLPGKTLWLWAVEKNVCVHLQRRGLKEVYYYDYDIRERYSSMVKIFIYLFSFAN